MKFRQLASLCAGLILAFAGHADAAGSKILVTFADPGMSNAARAGPVRPGYLGRSGTYLVSIEVRRAARRIETEFGLRQLDEWPIDPLKLHCIVYETPGGADVDNLLARLRQQPSVESAQKMNTFDVMAPERRGTADSYADLQDNMDQLEVAAAHLWTRGRGSSVTIIDTGADLDHPDLLHRVAEHLDFVAGDEASFMTDAHGTAVAGIIGASSDNGIGIVGVAPAASLSILKACWYPDGHGTAICNSFTLAKALSFAIDSPAQVINLSLAGPEDPLLARLVSHALAAGKVVIAAAPSAGGQGTFPAAVDGVIVVADVDSARMTKDGTLYAPGKDILVPVPGGGFDFASGNSLSAAHASGVAALLLARRPSLTPGEVRTLLATPSAGALISACRSLARLLAESGCSTAARAAEGAH